VNLATEEEDQEEAGSAKGGSSEDNLSHESYELIEQAEMTGNNAQQQLTNSLTKKVDR
jgi:hypothetical protein